MGEQNVQEHSAKELRRFMKNLLADVEAFETLLDSGMIETGVRRVGVEQELFLVDATGRPAFNAPKVLETLNSPQYTTELGLFNLEVNLEPMLYKNNCLRQMEAQLENYVNDVRKVANELGSDVFLTGILPTLRKSDMELKNMTPVPRYFALNNALTNLRGSDYELYIEGIDELIIKHKSIMLEACNTSFQVHFQVSPNEFATLYNLAQAVTAPLLAVATNSPLLFGHRLWQETRIAVFQQAVDTRQSSYELRNRVGRVDFGNRWVKNSILELFQDAIARFRVLLGAEIDEDPCEKLAQKIPPKFKALQIHNGTVYVWNRGCYGVTEGKAHLRIENRVLPSGPTIIDEVANAAFFFGMMSSLSSEYPDITKVMKFEHARANFLKASQTGLGTQFTWTHGKVYSAGELIQKELLPMAREGLAKSGIDKEDIERYLDVIEERVRTRQTGAAWMMNSFIKLQQAPQEQVLRSLVVESIEREKTKDPVHKWTLAELKNPGDWKQNFYYIEPLITRELFTVHQEELIELVAHMMYWRKVRHVLVEDEQGKLIGLISFRDVIKHFPNQDRDKLQSVAEFMKRDILKIELGTTTQETMKIMRQNKISCLPVVEGDALIGIITERDFSRISGSLLEDKLRGEKEKLKHASQVMTTGAFTARPDHEIKWLATKMQEHHLLSVAVTDDAHKLLGLITYRAFLRLFGKRQRPNNQNITAADIMVKNPVTISPETLNLEAIEIMRSKKIGCLPVVEKDKLIGMIGEHEYSELALDILKEYLAKS